MCYPLIYQGDHYRCRASANHPEGSRCPFRKVDHASFYERATIIDHDFDFLSGIGAGDQHLGTEGQTRVRCSQRLVIEGLATGGGGPLKRSL